MFRLKVFSTGIDKKCKHSLFLLVIFHDQRMTQFQFVKYICPLYKLHVLLYLLNLFLCPKFWAIFFDRSVTIVLGTVLFERYFLVLFGDCGNLFFDKTVFKILY